MAVERYANNATTALDGSITAASTTLTVNSAADFPTAGQFRILIDSEILVVTAVAGNIFTVSRGAEGTVAAAHNSNATVEHVLTKYSLVGTRGLDARQFGATGDGVTDDTAALQAALDALAAGTDGELFIPAGDYKLTSPLTIRKMTYKTIRGAEWGATALRQYTNNVAVLQTEEEDMAACSLRDLQLVYNTQQTSTDTGGVALYFNAATDMARGWHHWQVENIRIHQAHIGIGIGGSGSQRLTVWSSIFDRIWMTRISYTAIKMVSPGSVGGPITTFRDIKIVNTGSGGLISAGPAIEIRSKEQHFYGLDIEGWYDRIMHVYGGQPVSVKGLHIEWHVVDSTSNMFEVSDGHLSIEDSSVSFEVTTAAVATLLRAGAGGSITFRRARLLPTITSGSVVGISYHPSHNGSALDMVTDTSGAVTFPMNTMPFVGPFHPLIATANNITPNANQVILAAFTVPHTVRVTNGWVEVGTQSGNLDVGIYDDAGTRLGSSGTTAMGAAGTRQSLTLTTSVLLNPGRKYYAAIAVDNAVSALRGYVVAGTAGGLPMVENAATRVNSTYPLPASLSVAGAGSATKLFGLIFTP